MRVVIFESRAFRSTDLQKERETARSLRNVEFNLVPRVVSYPPYRARERAGRREPRQRGCVEFTVLCFSSVNKYKLSLFLCQLVVRSI